MEDIVKCSECGEPAETNMKEDEVPYGNPLETTLKVMVPVRKCKKCNFEWTDHVGEDILTKAVESYVMSAKIKKVKAKLAEVMDAAPEDLFEAVCILASQRDNAYNEASVYKEQAHLAFRMLGAFRVAMLAHLGQTRADRKTPYVLHPLRVATIVMSVNIPEGVSRLVAVLVAILHDVLEDSGKGRGSTKYSPQDMLDLFGEEVASVVLELTQDGSLPHAERRARMIAHCATMSRTAKLVKLADRLDNMRDMAHMPQDFVKRYCSEARQMLSAMEGACPELEAQIKQLVAKYEGQS